MWESDLFPPLREWLEERGYIVYSEVDPAEAAVPYMYVGRADVVAVNGPVLSIVEMKKTMCLELIGQAFSWKGFANYIYVAVPRPKRGFNRHAMRLLEKEGIGVLAVEHGWVQQIHKPKLDRKAITAWRNVLSIKTPN